MYMMQHIALECSFVPLRTFVEGHLISFRFTAIPPQKKITATEQLVHMN